jgi:hypothetical protein
MFNIMLINNSRYFKNLKTKSVFNVLSFSFNFVASFFDELLCVEIGKGSFNRIPLMSSGIILGE